MVAELPTGLLHLSLALFSMVLLLVLLVFRRWKAAEAWAAGMLCALIMDRLPAAPPQMVMVTVNGLAKADR